MLYLFFPESAHASSRTKNDVVYMRNGDKITCEIKSLSQGQLTVKPDYTDASIVLDWTKVDRVVSAQQFVVTDPNGEVYSGSITGDSKTKTLDIKEGDHVLALDATNVVEIDQLGTTFLKRLRGDADLGLSFARSNSQRNLTLQTTLGYQSAKYLFNLNTSSQFSTQQETRDTNETSAKSSGFRQLRESKWYAGGIANFLSSSEQQIGLRSTIGGAIARRQIFTNKTNLNFVGGLAYTHETDSGTASSTARNNAIDGAFAVQYSTFRFDSMTFDTSVWTYPSITSAGRVRVTFNQDVYYKFFSDFYVRMSFYDNYDNRPVVGTPSNNLGATTTFGWSFH
jgi:translation initiation factor IF-1